MGEGLKGITGTIAALGRIVMRFFPHPLKGARYIFF